MAVSVVDHSFPQTKSARLFPDKAHMGRSGVRVRVIVSRVVFWAFFEVALLMTLDPHVGHTKLPYFYALS